MDAMPPDDLPLVESTKLHRLCEVLGGEEGQTFTRDLVARFEQSIEGRLAAAQRATDASDWQGLEAVAHALKGAAATLGAVALQEHAAGLEHLPEPAQAPERLLRLRRVAADTFTAFEIELARLG